MTTTGDRPQPAAAVDPIRLGSATAWRMRARCRLDALACVLLVTGVPVMAGCSHPRPPTAAGAPPAVRSATTPPTTAASPGEPLIDLDVRPRTRREFQPAIALLRRYRELAGQQVREARRRERNRLARLHISDRCGVVSDCRDDATAAARYDQETRTCLVELYMSEIRKEAVSLDVPIPRYLAATLVHEQEHCLDDDGGEFQAIEAEVRLAREIGDFDDPTIQGYLQTMLAVVGPDGSWLEAEPGR